MSDTDVQVPIYHCDCCGRDFADTRDMHKAGFCNSCELQRVADAVDFIRSGDRPHWNL